MYQKAYEIFVFYVSMPLVVTIGLIGNLFCIRIINRVRSNTNKFIYRYIFTIDSLVLFSSCYFYFLKGYNINVLASTYTCKIVFYLSYSLAPIPSILFVYILIERFLTIKYPLESNLLCKVSVQRGYLWFMILVHFIYYSPTLVYYDDIKIENTNGTFISICEVHDLIERHTVFLLCITGRVFVPFFLILIFSFLLVYRIIKSRNHLLTFYSRKENLIYKYDIHLSKVTVLFNLTYIGLQLPCFLIYFSSSSTDFQLAISMMLFYISYAFNFYFMFALNKNFRKQFYNLFKRNQNTIAWYSYNIVIGY